MTEQTGNNKPNEAEGLAFPPNVDQGAAASCHLCVGAGGYEDHDGEWVECSCQRLEPQGEPSDCTKSADSSGV